MITYKENWEQTQRRMEAYWNKDYIDRCMLAITVPREGGKPVFPPRKPTPVEHFSDPQTIHEGMINGCAQTEFLAESIPSRIIEFGVAAECRYFGCKRNYTPDTIWFDPVLPEPDISLLQYDDGPFQDLKKLTSELVSRAGHDYFVGMNDNCGIIDGLAHLRGTENLLTDMIEEPEFVHAARDKIVDAWIRTQAEIFEIVKDNNLGGSSHGWMHLWSPKRHLQLQCDYACMISPSMFEEFVLPELEDTANAFEHCTYHLDGIEQIRHLDLILSVKGIDNIQWTHVAGQPKTSESIEALQKIQAAGKGLVLIPQRDELEFLMKNLSHKGLQIVVGGMKDRQEAEDLMALARKLAH